MKILLAPSEGKLSGGTGKFSYDKLLFPKLKEKRNLLLERYVSLIKENKDEVLSKMFGLKNLSDVEFYKKDLNKQPVMKAIVRYSGVSFEYLSYADLNEVQRSYLDDNVILFSNLFGPLRASDLIPDYKLKQGEGLDGIQTDKLYRDGVTILMEEYLGDEEILDLRSGYYDKFYKPKKEYTTLKFVKNGKVVSHWAKAYRGIVARECAKNNVKSIEELKMLNIEGLEFKEEKKTKNKTEIVYNVI